MTDLMQRTKGLAALILVVVFIAGAALGYAVDRSMARSHGRPGPRDMARRMAEELKLTPDQKVTMDALFEQRRQQMRDLYKPLRPQLDSLAQAGHAISESTHAQIRRILTPEQQTKWDEMRARFRRDAEAARKRFGENPPSAPMATPQKK